MPYTPPAGNAINFTFQGSPAYTIHTQSYAGVGDWNLTWIRRTRVSGEWRSLVDVPLGETSEAYEVDIFSDSTYSVIRRTLISNTSSVTYTSAQQIADFGNKQTTLYLKIYQISSAVGRGYPLTTSITR